jgi:glyoxylase-like metal-dependent hydrolase (beta-lactamase superfamily II)
MEIFRLEPGISLIDLSPPIPGFEGILGAFIIQAQKIALIDVGPTATLGSLFSALAELKIDPSEVAYNLLTHIHLDHSGGIGGAMQRMPNARCLVHEKGFFHLAHPAKLWEGSRQTLGKVAEEYGEPEAVSEERLIVAREGQQIDLGDVQFEVMMTPGHAAHHLSLFDRKRGKLFPGEAAGVFFPHTNIIRPACPPPFDLRQALNSVNKLIAAQPREIYYQHFGYSPNAMAQLLKYKERLIFWSKIVVQHLDDDPQKVVAEILTQDKTRELVYSLPPNRVQLELFFNGNNVRGLQDYFRREGTDVLEEL